MACNVSRRPNAAKPGVKATGQRLDPACNGRITGRRPRLRIVYPTELAVLRGPFGRFRTDQDGATAIEFAIVAPLFFMIVLGLLEVALLFVTDVSIDSATASFARQIRTGQLQAPGAGTTSSSGVQLDLVDAKSWICKKITLVSLENCTNQLQLDIRPINSFRQTNTISPINGPQFNSSNLCYYSGNAGDIVEIRAYYLFSLIDPLLTATFSKITSYQTVSGSTSGNFFPITTTQVFKSENYSGSPNTGAGC